MDQINGESRRSVVILGVNGNSFDILETLRLLDQMGKIKADCLGFLDDDPDKRGQTFHGLKVLGGLREAYGLSVAVFVNGIGSERNFIKKPEILQSTGMSLQRFISVVHPSAFVSPSAHIGLGTVLLQNVTVGAEASVGNHVIILPNSTVSHNSRVGDYSCIAAGVCISGNVQVQDNCYLGTGSCFRSGLSVGPGSLVGMGSVVVKDVPEGLVVAGNPAKILRTVV